MKKEPGRAWRGKLHGVYKGKSLSLSPEKQGSEIHVIAKQVKVDI